MTGTGASPTFTIRRAVRDDIPSIAAVHVASWRENYAGIVEQRLIDARTVDVRIAQWSAMFDQPGRITLLAAASAGTTLGFASALSLSPPLEGYDSYLQLLYLDPGQKGRGIGRALLSAVARDVRASGRANMALRVARLNPARAFYERLGARLAPNGISLDAGLFDDVVYEFPNLRTLL